MTIGSGLRRKQKKKRGPAFVLVIFIVIGIVAGWRAVDFSETVEKLYHYFSAVVPHSPPEEQVRGTVYDRTGQRLLAVSLPRVSVYARPREMTSIEGAAKTLTSILAVGEGEIEEKLRSGELRVWLARDISDEQEEALKKAALGGVYLHDEFSRYYPMKEVAAHLIGFVQDDIGLSGVEYYYDRLVQRMLGQAAISEFDGGFGQNLVLTLDLKVQELLEKLAAELMVGRKNSRIGIYAMDAGSGALIAAVQLPSFDPNRYRIYSQQLLQNLFVQPMLLPPLYRALLRDSAAIQSQYETRGSVVPWSVSAMELSLGGELRLWEKLGFSDSLPAEFGNGESRTIRTTDFFVVSGQTARNFGTVPESLSPLRLLSAFGVLTNGGKQVSPHVVQAVTDRDDEEEILLYPTPDEAPRVEVINRDAAKEVSAMVAALGVPTKLGGTILQDRLQAEVGNGTNFAHVSNDLYLAAVPVEFSELVVLVTIQGGSLEVPTRKTPKAADTLQALAAILPRIAVLQEVGKGLVGVAEPEEPVTGNYPVHFNRAREIVRSSLMSGQEEVADPGPMPDLNGLSLRKSLRLLRGATCQIKIFGTGTVISQKPAPGASLAGVTECVIRMQNQDDVSLEAFEEKGAERK